MKRFKKFLLEGGNVVLRSGESAQKIPVEKIDRTEIQNMLIDTLKKFSIAFGKKYDRPIWQEFNHLFKNDMIFSGSSRLFFSKRISDDEFKTHKKLVGDIDTMYDKNISQNLLEFCMKSEGKKFGDMRFVGAGGTSIIQINVLFELPEKFWDKIRFVQVDFEPVEYENNQPNEFSLFSHYSSWSDMKEGIKGVFVKYLYRSIFHNLEKIQNYVIITKTGKVSNSKIFENDLSLWKFSVDKGVRIGYEPIIENGVHKIINGKKAYREIDTKNSTYEQSMNTIFQLAFDIPPNKQDLKKMGSFLGVLEILSKTKKNIEEIFEDYINLLWGSGAQNLERNNDKIDFENKLSSYSAFLKKFPEMKKFHKKCEDLIEKYYKE